MEQKDAKDSSKALDSCMFGFAPILQGAKNKLSVGPIIV